MWGFANEHLTVTQIIELLTNDGKIDMMCLDICGKDEGGICEFAKKCVEKNLVNHGKFTGLCPINFPSHFNKT